MLLSSFLRIEVIRLSEERKLAAIVFTDMVGYTGLSQRDERLALQLLDKHNILMRRVLNRHRGKEIKAIGDAFLMEFGSALEATEFAIDAQRELRALNSKEPPERNIVVRIGIHVGDVVERQGDIFGDAVNVASRIYPLAEPGGVCLTEEVFLQVRNKIPYKMEKLPEQGLKHVEYPMSIYKVIIPFKEGEVVGGAASKTRLAVLPLTNISPDPRDEYLADGMTEELITVLSQVQGLRVIARTSVDQYRGRERRVSQIAKELGVGSVMEGSVRKAGDKVRVTVQLVDAETEEHVWSQSYDRELTDVFLIQSDIAKMVAENLKLKLLDRAEERIEGRAPEDVSAYMKYLEGRTLMQSRSREGLRGAELLFEEALRLDPDYALAHAGLADCIYLQGDYRYRPMLDAVAVARRHASKALELNPDLAEAHASFGILLMQDYWFADSDREFRTAISLNPSYVTAHHWYSLCLSALGKAQEALEEALQAEKEDPRSLVVLLNAAGFLVGAGRIEEAEKRLAKAVEIDRDNPVVWGHQAYFAALRKDFDRAIEWEKKVAEAQPDDPGGKAELGFMYGLAGRQAEARRILEELKALPDTVWEKPGLIAYVSCALGDFDQAFAQAKLAVHRKAFSFSGIRQDPFMERIREDPRWGELLAAAGLPP
jgi:adenylate cyclase